MACVSLFMRLLGKVMYDQPTLFNSIIQYNLSSKVLTMAFNTQNSHCVHGF